MTSTISQIIWPRPAAAGCTVLTMVRDTRGVPLEHAQRFNFFPASPFCSVTWTFAGDCHWIDQADQVEQPWTGEKLPGLAFCGAQLGPVMSWNPGETRSIATAFYPDAFSAMTGLDLSPFTGRAVSAEEVLPQPILQLCRDLFAAVERDGVERALSAFEEQIVTLWARVRPASFRPARWVKDWSRSLALKAALSGSGRSARQIARRIKSWTGVSERDLRGIGHSEQLYAKWHEAMQNGDVDWAELAAAAGFADQPHMIRQIRRSSGFTPEQLRQRARDDEAFWAYRLLGEYFEKR
jgi:AraC-like DNA-binding protein